VWAGYELPDLGLDTADPVESRFEAVYWDAPDLRLLRRGVTVRQEGGEWTLRAPDGLVATVDAGELPAPVLGWTRGEPLREVARLATVRESFALSNRRGEVARLARDDVALLRGERVAARFRELELTPLDATPARLLERIEARLRDAGAQSLDPVPKVIRGLAPAAHEPPPAPPEAGADATAGEAIRARLAAALERWAEHQAALQLDGGPESVRGIRGGIRALRRDLRVFTPVVDARAALGRVVDPLTVVRRLDRLIERADELAGLREALVAERGPALAVARATLSGPRYAELLREAAALVERPPLPAKSAGRPAADVLPGLVRGPLRRLSRAPADDPERQRKLADRLAAAASAAVPYADARAALAELDELRTVLREHHHATTAIELLAALAAGSPAHAWEAGLLAGAERTRAAEARNAVAYAFTRATRRKLWAWVP
jgi:CHAD domain